MRKLARPYTDPTPLFRHGGRRADQRHLLDFSASINPLGPPQSVLRVLRDGLDEIAHYPDPECRELTERIAAYHHVDPDMVVVGNGSNELIYAIARAFRPKRVAIAEPTYTEYLRASLLVGAEADHWLAEGSSFKFRMFDPESAEIVWLCNPNNPTGGFWAGAEALARWMHNHRRAIFVVDETFLPLSEEYILLSRRALPRTMVHETRVLDNLIVLCSFTKVFALPGIRLGYTISSPQLAGQIRQELVPWSVNALAQVAGITALGDSEYTHQTHTWLTERFLPALTTKPAPEFPRVHRNFHPVPSSTNFVLVKLRGITSAEFVRRLSLRGFLVRDASNFVGLDGRYVRIAVRTTVENQRFLDALPAVLEG
jgi:threonine-phosphate decarboxylase